LIPSLPVFFGFIALENQKPNLRRGDKWPKGDDGNGPSHPQVEERTMNPGISVTVKGLCAFA
jgi:hypothetical protein